jgi:pyruvate-formate lyase-activating enzyme
LNLPEEILKRGFTLEVLSLYIPGLVETEELKQIAQILNAADPDLPFTVLAFFPEHRMKDFRSPLTQEMVDAYQAVKSTGLTNVRLGNLGVFLRTEADWKTLMAKVDRGAF